MTPSQLLSKHKTQLTAISKQFAVKNVRYFGSVLHGTDKADSDLDLLVEPLPTTTLFDLCGLKMEFEHLLGIKVDIVTPNSLPPNFRDEILSTAKFF